MSEKSSKYKFDKNLLELSSAQDIEKARKESGRHALSTTVVLQFLYGTKPSRQESPEKRQNHPPPSVVSLTGDSQ